MNKLSISGFLHRYAKLLACTFIPLLTFITIAWIIPALVPFLTQNSGTQDHQISVSIILSIVVYPCWILLLAIIISTFHQLKPHDEGGLIGDSLLLLKIWLLIVCAICAMLCLIHYCTEASIRNFLQPINEFLFVGTMIGISLSVHSLTREFIPKKFPIGKFIEDL